MGRFAPSTVIYYMFLCCVQWQRNYLVVGFVDVAFVNNTPLNPGWSPHDAISDSKSNQLHPTTAPVSRDLLQTHTRILFSNSQTGPSGNRSRRQVYLSQNSINGPWSWSHKFSMEGNYPGNTQDSANIWKQNTDRLKYVLEKNTEFQFLDPTGLKIYIPVGNLNVRIVDFRIKLNEAFWGSSDGGQYAPIVDKSGGQWTYDVPQLNLKQGGKVYYWMHFRFDKEGFDVMVNGELGVTFTGSSHDRGTQTQLTASRPTRTPVYRPPPQPPYGVGVPNTLSGGLGGGTGGGFAWSYQFNIDPSRKGAFPKDHANRWLQQAEVLKSSLENKINFQFLNPTGLMVLIPENNITSEIEQFRVKFNEDFRSNDYGHFTSKGERANGQWIFNVPQLKVKQGDKIYFHMKVKFGKEESDAIIRLVLDINKGDPRDRYNVIHTPLPSLPPPRVPTTNFVGTNPASGGSLGGGFSWAHRFRISSSPNTVFTPGTASSWDEAQINFKNTLEKDIEFKFLNPTGLSISISGDTEENRILAFNIKLDEDFKNLEPGQYVANITRMADGRLSYYYPNLKLTKGHKLYYWMRATLGKEAFDNIVKGELEVKQGNPHNDGPIVPIPPTLDPGIYVQPNSEQNIGTENNKKPNSGQNFGNGDNNQPNPAQNYGNGNYNKPNPAQNFGNGNHNQPNIAQNYGNGNYNQPNPAQNYGNGNYNQPNPAQNYGNGNYNQPNPAQNFNTGNYNKPTSTHYFGNGNNNQPNSPTTPQYNGTSTYILDPQTQNIVTGNFNQPCVTTQNGGIPVEEQPCQGAVLLEHQFNTNSMDGWTHQVTIGGQYPEDEFMCFTKDHENSWVDDGKLIIKPTLLEDKYNDSFVRSGELPLTGCTTPEIKKNCHRRGIGFSILPPINTARLNTKGTFSFLYGTVEIRAKFPRGDWLVPELWLEPTNSDPEEKIVIGLSRGNIDSWHQLQVGVVQVKESRPQPLKKVMGPRPWSQDFHDFKLIWTPDHMRFFVDNRQVHELSANDFAILRQEVYISLGIHAGGPYDFPDDMYREKPWDNEDQKRIARFWDAKLKWYPTWRKEDKFYSTLQVEYVKITAL